MTELHCVLITIPINWFLWMSLIVYSDFYPNGWIDGIKGNGFEDAIKKRIEDNVSTMAEVEEEEKWLWENIREMGDFGRDRKNE